MRDLALKLGCSFAALLCLVIAGAADAQRAQRGRARRDPALVVAEEIARRVHTFHNFRGDVPHGPEVLSETPTLFLAIIIYGRGRE